MCPSCSLESLRMPFLFFRVITHSPYSSELPFLRKIKKNLLLLNLLVGNSEKLFLFTGDARDVLTVHRRCPRCPSCSFGLLFLFNRAIGAALLIFLVIRVAFPVIIKDGIPVH